MTKFKLDINKSVTSEEKLEKLLQEYDQKSDETFLCVKNSCNNWTDQASIIFEKIVLDNEKTAKDIKSSLNSYLANAKNFSSTLKTLFVSKDYEDNADLRLAYNTPYLTYAIENASSVNSSLSEALSIYGSLTVPSGFYLLGSINASYNTINSVKGDMSTIYSDLNEIKTTIENLLITTDTTHKAITLVQQDRTVVSFVWRMMSPEVIQIPERVEDYGNAEVGAVVSATADQAIIQQVNYSNISQPTTNTEAEQATVVSSEQPNIVTEGQSTVAQDITLISNEQNNIVTEGQSAVYKDDVTLSTSDDMNKNSDSKVATMEDINNTPKEQGVTTESIVSEADFSEASEKTEEKTIVSNASTASFDEGKTTVVENKITTGTTTAEMDIHKLPEIKLYPDDPEN